MLKTESEIMRTKKLIIPPINIIGTMIDMSNLDRWIGNCYCVASKIVKEQIIDDDCRAVYGHYLGPVSSKSFFSDRRGMPFISHGWIVLSNGDIIDPTRWVFEAKKPYIAHLDSMDDIMEEYDEGGNEWRAAHHSSAPQYDKTERIFSLYQLESENEKGYDYLLELLMDERNFSIKDVSLNQMFWIANMPLQHLGIYAKDIYTWIKCVGCVALLPMDNRLKILGKD